MYKLLLHSNNKTALSIWIMVALLLFVPVAKYQHLSEHSHHSEQQDTNLHNCKTCSSSIYQDFDTSYSELNFTPTVLNELLVVLTLKAAVHQTFMVFNARAPPFLFQ